MYDVIIRNGEIYNGTGNPSTKLDIAIKDGKIDRIDKLNGIQSKTYIDASELAVAPGFIDTHTHSDLLCTIPEVHKIRVLQGITTELLGQDGISVAPVSTETKPLWQKQLKGLNGEIEDWPWESVDDYLSYLDSTPIAGNVLYLVPHGGVRTLVMGFEERKATAAELNEMRLLVEKAMQQGAVGISSGLIYPPNVFSDKRELIEICKGSAKYNGSFVVHIRNESTKSMEALDEVIDVARKSGVRLHISHFKAMPGKYEKALKKMEDARDEGIEITFDQYPYAAASTVFHSILPPWMHSGGTEKLLERLESDEIRKRIKQDFANNADYENIVLNCGWENIFINSVQSDENRHLEGKNLKEIAKLRDQDPSEAVFDLLIEEKAAITMSNIWGKEEHIIHAMKHPLQMVGSDGIFANKPHPRLYGSFSRVLGRYGREKSAFHLGEGIRKMTGAPAQFLRLKDRGLLLENYKADIVIFDPNTIIDNATFDDPLENSTGISYVLVNGKITVKNGEFTGETAGEVIRR